MENQKLEALRAETIRQLRDIQKKKIDPAEDAKNLMRRLIGRKLPPRDLLFWPTGMLMLGLAAGNITSAEKEALAAAVRNWEKAGKKLYYPDDTLSGAALLTAALLNTSGSFGIKEEFMPVLKQMKQFLDETPRDPSGMIIYRPGRGNEEILADGIGMSAMFYALYGRVCGDTASAAEAARQLRLYLDKASEPGAGFPFHGLAGEEKKGLCGWGRAVGWLLLGMAETAAALPDGEENIAERTRQLFDRILPYQRKNGLLPWKMTDDLTEPTDLSASAMTGYALLRMRQQGLWLRDREKQYGVFTRKLKDGILKQTDENGRADGALAECLGFGQHPQHYGVYPWGQGSALAFLKLAEQENNLL